MGSIASQFAPKLQPGYRFLPAGRGAVKVIGPNGRPVRSEDGRILVLDDHDADPFARSMFDRELRKCGALPPRRQRVAKPRVRRTIPTDSKPPIMLAHEVMADPKATPRERALSRDYIRLHEVEVEIRALAKTLVHRLKEGDFERTTA